MVDNKQKAVNKCVTAAAKIRDDINFAEIKGKIFLYQSEIDNQIEESEREGFIPVIDYVQNQTGKNIDFSLADSTKLKVNAIYQEFENSVDIVASPSESYCSGRFCLAKELIHHLTFSRKAGHLVNDAESVSGLLKSVISKNLFCPDETHDYWMDRAGEHAAIELLMPTKYLVIYKRFLDTFKAKNDKHGNLITPRKQLATILGIPEFAIDARLDTKFDEEFRQVPYLAKYL